MSISRQATSAELSMCTSCSLDQWQSDNERAWRMCVCVYARVRACVCMCNFAANLVKILQWHLHCLTKQTRKGSPRPKKAQMSQSMIKVLLGLFFDWKGIVHNEFVPCGQIVNKQLYQEGLVCLRDAVCGNRSELWENQTWMLHNKNAPAHASLLIRIYLAKHPLCPYTLFSRLSPSRLFPVSQT